MEKENQNLRVTPIEITTEMKKSYLDYAMSVIVSRALPDIRDGLKPVHRRILFAMHQMGLEYPAKYTKSAKIVGETMGKYHPHGDMPIYGALVRLAQNFSMRYPLVDGQGNFGSVDGDSPAAMRYTEARMQKISSEMLADIEKETVDFRDNFDETVKEPAYLPAKIPNLLLMGSDGIAVGMATKIPPHNLTEIIDGLLEFIKKGKVILESNGQEKLDFEIKKINFEELGKIESYKNAPALKASFESEATVEDLVEFIKGPDFPSGATIYGQEGINQYFASGKGRVIVQAVANIEEAKSGKFKIIIEEIPYQVNKAQLVAKIADLIKNKKIKGITDLRDESDRNGMRIVLELKKTARPKVILNKLFKHTQMQTSYPVNMVALIDDTPQTVNLKTILTAFIKHRQTVIAKKSVFELDAAKKRAHILEGLKIALDNLDEVIATIRKSKTVNDAKDNLIKKFKLSTIQAEAILEMQLRRLAALERQKIEDEYKELLKMIDYLSELLLHPEKILEIIKEELALLKEKYGDARRTKIYKKELGDFSEADLVADEKCLIAITKTGYIKRMPTATYKSQRRGGKGVMGMTTKEEDEISYFITGQTHDSLLFFTNKGKVYSIKTWEIPETVRISKGNALINFINIDQDEKIQSVLNLPSNLAQSEYNNLVLATKKGIIKKTSLKKFANIRTSGLIAIKLNKDDQLCWARLTTGNDQILLVSHNGKSVRFNETDVRSMGRDTIGVRGINLKADDFVVGMETFLKNYVKSKDKRKKIFRDILIITEHGIGKRTPVANYPLQKRGGIGVKTANITEKTGKIAAALLVDEKIDQIIINSKKAQVIKLPLKNIPTLGRNTQGVILMRFSKKQDTCATINCLKKLETEDS